MRYANTAEPMDYTEFENLLGKSIEYLRACNAKSERHFGIGSYQRYEYDLTRSEMWWSSLDGPKVRGKVTVVGTLSSISDTWFWAWANPHFRGIEAGLIDKVRAFGECEEIPKLTEEKWEADEVDAWEMTSICARLLESEGAYCSPGDSGSLFLLYNDLEFIPSEEIGRYIPLKRQVSYSATDSDLRGH